VDGNDELLKEVAVRNAQAVGAGHSFVVVMKDGFPINILGRIKDVPEVVNLFCATANPVEVIVAQSEQGRGILGVIDGSSPAGVETEDDAKWRHGFLRKIGYKR
jgi:adenosine/AMP kinase